MTRFRLACTLLFGMLLALCTTAYAQKITSTLTGTVVDSTNAVVSDAAITVTNQATGTSRSTKTNPEGQYSVLELDPGVYSVKVNKAGFKEVVQKNLELHVGDTRELRTELPPGQASESTSSPAASSRESMACDPGDLCRQRRLAVDSGSRVAQGELLESHHVVLPRGRMPPS